MSGVKREVDAWAKENKASEYTITTGIQGLGLHGSVSATFKVGVRVIACRQCTENLHVADALGRLGVGVFYAGQFLTD